jgi:L-rhamnose mutarotase
MGFVARNDSAPSLATWGAAADALCCEFVFSYSAEELLQRVCFLLNVRPDKLEEYKARHREVWPDMIRALRESGWSNYSLFLRPDGLLVGYLETPDFDQALAEMNRRAVNEQWQREMAPYFLSRNGDSRMDEAMVPIEEIFHLD